MELPYRLRSRRRRSSRRSAATSSRSSRRSSRWTAARSRSTPTTSTRSAARGRQQTLPLMYWGKYVAHDNNRDGMGQFLALTRNVTKAFLDWKPTIMHDLHEAQTYLYASTGTGPYNEAARSDHHRRVVAAGQDRSDGDDQARRARRVDLRVLRRLGAELHVLHRPRAQRDRPLLRGAGLRARQLRSRHGGAERSTSREWFRPNPPLPSIKWGPRNNTNIQQSAMLIALNHVAKNRETVSRELLAEEQARRRQGQGRPGLRLGDSGGAEAEGRRRRRGQRAAPAGPRGPHARPARSRPALSTSSPATTSSAATSRTARSPTCTSRCRTTRRPTRSRTTTPAGRSSTCATWRSSRSPSRACSISRWPLVTADVKAPGGIDGHRPGRIVVDAHHRQQPRDVPLQAHGREDAGRRGGIRGGRAAASAPARSSSRTPIARRWSRR